MCKLHRCVTQARSSMHTITPPENVICRSWPVRSIEAWVSCATLLRKLTWMLLVTISFVLGYLVLETTAPSCTRFGWLYYPSTGSWASARFRGCPLCSHPVPRRRRKWPQRLWCRNPSRRLSLQTCGKKSTGTRCISSESGRTTAQMTKTSLLA